MRPISTMLNVMLLAALACFGCGNDTDSTDWTPLIATEAAAVTIEKPAPPVPDPP